MPSATVPSGQEGPSAEGTPHDAPPGSELDLLVEQAVALAAELGRKGPAAGSAGSSSRRFAAIVSDGGSRRFVSGLTDEVIRIRDPSVALRRLRRLVAETGMPRFAGAGDAFAIRLGTTVGFLVPGFTMSKLRKRLRGELAGVVLDAGEPALTELLQRRHGSHMRCNVNLLGEAVLGDRQADLRMEAVSELVRRRDVDQVSVKLSGLCANVSPYAVEHAVERFRDRLRGILEVAASCDPPTMVTLDMERYDELLPTAEAFVRTLSEPQFRDLTAGIALQAYLPDTLSVASGLCAWAARRVEAGGAPVRIRLVKGANLSMERVEAELNRRPPAPFDHKADTDANYKRVLAMLLDPAWAGAVHVGLASHNLFDVAWGLTLSRQLGAGDHLEVEMLEGMAEEEAEAVTRVAGSVLLYAPIVADADFDAAVAYLARRLEENTQPGNFLTDMFDMVVGDTRWQDQASRFRESVAALGSVRTEPRRDQDRNRPMPMTDPEAPFANAADTDWVHAPNREWIARHLRRGLPPAPAPVDTLASVDQLVATGHRGRELWSTTTMQQRRGVLSAVADRLEARRGELIATMVAETSKTVPEADVEVSEAVDFARWYAACLSPLGDLVSDGMVFEPYGLVVVAGPWNFPLSIPAGGVLAALAAGAATVLKPAPEAQRCGQALAECLWEAGIPVDALQFAPVPDGDAGRHLVTHPGVDAVLLTGSVETARRFLEWDPRMVLHAETSGKNAMVLAPSADLDLAITDLVHSAFGHAGQKCSAASLAICLPSVYDDPAFRRRLADAVGSLRVGDPADPATDVADLIAAPGEHLQRALTRLDTHEEWLVEPRCLDPGQRRWSPGVRLGVQPGSFLHLTECFGPVLGVMRAPNLSTAVQWQNATAYGLTGGIHSLDPADLRYWCDHVEVGNAYVNRPITGAIVRRQPFGGWKASSVGPTVKAGGPNTVLWMGRWSRAPDVHGGSGLDVARAAQSFDQWWEREFGVDHDPSALSCEANVLRYVPLQWVVLRVGPGVAEREVVVALGAATVVGAAVELSLPGPWESLQSSLPADIEVIVESDANFLARVAVRPGVAPRVRLLGRLADDDLRALHLMGAVIDDHPVSDHGRIELLHWVREQSLSVTLHRHGVVQERFRSCLGSDSG